MYCYSAVPTKNVFRVSNGKEFAEPAVVVVEEEVEVVIVSAASGSVRLAVPESHQCK